MRYEFWTSCAGLSGPQVDCLGVMKDDGEEVSYEAFREAVGGDVLDAWASQHNYDDDLKLSDDPHVAYYRSAWNSLPVYFLVWSAFEMIFVPEDFDERRYSLKDDRCLREGEVVEFWCDYCKAMITDTVHRQYHHNDLDEPDDRRIEKEVLGDWTCSNDHTGCLWNDGHNGCSHPGQSLAPLEPR